MGAPGSGTTTIARALAEALGYKHLDTDDYHWFTSDPEPYRRRRNPDHRRTLLSQDLAQYPQWVLSGSLCGWGDCFAPEFDLVVFCTAPVPTRLARIHARELARYGAERLSEQGDLHGVFVKFKDWAAHYDTETTRIRSLEFEKKWLATHLTCPVIPVDTEGDLAVVLARVEEIVVEGMPETKQ